MVGGIPNCSFDLFAVLAVHNNDMLQLSCTDRDQISSRHVMQRYIWCNSMHTWFVCFVGSRGEYMQYRTCVIVECVLFAKLCQLHVVLSGLIRAAGRIFGMIPSTFSASHACSPIGLCSRATMAIANQQFW